MGDRSTTSVRPALELCWLPLGAGGHFVRFNGRVYESVQAFRARRPPCDLFHTALQVHLPEGPFVIESAWPIPNADGRSRGVTVEGPVFSHRLARFRVFRYEVRRWKNGTIADLNEAAAIQGISDDEDVARRVFDLADLVPPFVWGRDEAGVGEMWNSNSVISWLLAGSGLPVDSIRPPIGGRAPGWEEGIAASRLHRRPLSE